MEINNEIDLIEILKNVSPKEGLSLIEKYEGLVVKKYYEITTYKIKFLIALNKYLEAKLLISEELKAPYIPSDFQKFLLESNTTLDQNFKVINNNVAKEIDFDNLDKLDNASFIKVFPSLEKYDVKYYLLPLERILLTDNFDNSIKSLILALLNEKKVNKEIKVMKNNNEFSINPINLKDIRESNCYQFIANTISKMYEVDKNLLDLVSQLANVYLLDIYPNDLDGNEASILFAALLDMAIKMLNSDLVIIEQEKIIIKNKKKVDYYQEKVNNLLKGI